LVRISYLSIFVPKIKKCIQIPPANLRTTAAVACVILLGFHFYYYCYQGFAAAGFTHPIVDRFVRGLARTGLFRHSAVSKLLALLALAGTALGVKTPAQVKSRRRLVLAVATGSGLYFGSDILLLPSVNAILFPSGPDPSTVALLYIGVTLTGLILSYTSVKALIGLLSWPQNAVFNTYNESFPQEERLLKGPESIHLKARYNFRNQLRNSIINLSQVYRGTLVMGSPGSGKTRYVFRQLIQQSLANGMCLFVYDLKYDDLTRLTWNTFQREKTPFPGHPGILFRQLRRLQQKPPLQPP
jgi:hypothetical protein